jgi:hypothetical protein
LDLTNIVQHISHWEVLTFKGVIKDALPKIIEDNALAGVLGYTWLENSVGIRDELIMRPLK